MNCNVLRVYGLVVADSVCWSWCEVSTTSLITTFFIEWLRSNNCLWKEISFPFDNSDSSVFTHLPLSTAKRSFASLMEKSLHTAQRFLWLAVQRLGKWNKKLVCWHRFFFQFGIIPNWLLALVAISRCQSILGYRYWRIVSHAFSACAQPKVFGIGEKGIGQILKAGKVEENRPVWVDDTCSLGLWVVTQIVQSAITRLVVSKTLFAWRGSISFSLVPL